jgi:hypothetical protein
MSKQIAQTILEQLGGRRFIAMTGAKNFGFLDSVLDFWLPSSPTGVNRVAVILKDDDTYTVKFFKVKGIQVRTMNEVSGVYCDMLEDVFVENTGLLTRLGRKVVA